MKKSKKIISTLLALTMAFSLSACGAKDKSTSAEKEKDSIPTIDQIKLGEDYTDLKADLKVITHRTDLVDNVFKDYISEFQKTYPNISIEYEGITNYADDITTRLTSSSWGDICMVPPSISKSELSNYFVSFGDLDTLEKNYIMLQDKAYDNEVYGIPSVGNAQGVVYNKKVFADAGITELPKTPDEFLDALQQIKDKTDAIPLYTNFNAQWTMTAWDAYVGGTSNGDPDYIMKKMVHGKNPFSKNDDMTGPYAVYYVLYESVARGLVEDDPTTTDWEGCKGQINNGKIGTMVLGSWAVSQMQAAGDHPDDIAYMPFPITVNGKQYASAGPDYQYGINVNASKENKIASMIYIKWLTEKSDFAFDQGSIPIMKGSDYPDVLDAFSDTELIINNPAKEGEEDYFDTINSDSEVGLNSDNVPDSQIVEHALAKDMTLDEIMDEWNQKWSQAQKDNDIEVEE
ncbi:ABC transporter substrate-binding protein [[Clostridium] polysaccharolyticum]|uniref:Carbohydrate ABC transporter substrate-binding protein, CUT1 family (TC 3.A.1.1.-) n=1 Tax=[Clostridium] polysaccharolyticum TaxID=29364 RepID=A0A1I0F5M2_9FIRM|nr:ABC transporter substrate-binding protein [[Clostridium] polysaccharolyticum]SET52361.1 carbohydrate ABC transporter substrate-binding protein, CUT1 family (TC 3.A.1.1.-) [[Clostridium] polysaccharolyticum]